MNGFESGLVAGAFIGAFGAYLSVLVAGWRASVAPRGATEPKLVRDCRRRAETRAEATPRPWRAS